MLHSYVLPRIMLILNLAESYYLDNEIVEEIKIL